MSLITILALAAPLFLVGTMLIAFKWLHIQLSYPAGYLVSFLIYWFGWCLLFPVLLLGGLNPLKSLFTPLQALTSLPRTAHLALWWPIAFPLLFTFILRLLKITASVFFVSLLLGIIIGITEEILWRGVYLHHFPDNLWLGILYPSLLFGIWHICSQSVLKNKLPGGAYSFITYAVFLGLTYVLATRLTGSIFWPAVSHVLHDTLGLGGFAYAAWLSKTPPAEPPLP